MGGAAEFGRPMGGRQAPGGNFAGGYPDFGAGGTDPEDEYDDDEEVEK